MISSQINFRQASANDCENQVSDASQVDVPPSPEPNESPLQYGASKIMPNRVRFELPVSTTKPEPVIEERPGPEDDATLNLLDAQQVIGAIAGFHAPANDAGYVHERIDALEAVVECANDADAHYPELPTTASLLITAAKQSMPAVEHQGEPLITPEPPVTAPFIQISDAAPTAAAAQPQQSLSWWRNPHRRVKFLYVALLPTVIVVNTSYESIRDKVREIGRALENVSSLQRQVAELKSAPAKPANAQAPQASTANPASQPIPPELMRNRSVNWIEAQMPSPIGNPGDEPEPRAQPTKKPSGRQGAAASRAEKEAEQPEEEGFVLANDQKATPAKGDSAVPPANEFKLIGDK